MALIDHFTVWFVGSLIVVAIFCTFLLKRYAFAPKQVNIATSQTTASGTIKALTFIGWFLGFATIALLPLDIALANDIQSEGDSHSLADKDQQYGLQMRSFWTIFYWVTFTFAYLIAPFMSYYDDSGEIEMRKKLLEAAFYTVATYALYAVAVIIFLIILWARGTFSEEDFTLNGFVMALGCVFGLLQIIVFLGYGLVSVPKSIYCQATLE